MRYIVKEANQSLLNGEYKKAIDLFKEAETAYPQLAKALEFNIKLAEEGLGIGQDSVDVSITLTTISERLDLLKPVLESLHNQTKKPKAIYVHLSEEPYLLDKGVSKTDPRVLELEKLPLVKICWVKNTGPYRKIVPFLERFYAKESAIDEVFITIDDDTLYPDYFIETLYREFVETNSVVAFRGRCITLDKNKVAGYQDWGLGETELHFNNLPTGKDGVIYSTKFFTKNFVDTKQAIENAPTADDLWIKWHCALNGVKAKILNPEAATSDYKSFPVVDYSSEYRDVSLFKAHNSHTSGGKNDASVKALESHFSKVYGYNLADVIGTEVEA